VLIFCLQNQVFMRLWAYHFLTDRKQMRHAHLTQGVMMKLIIGNKTYSSWSLRPWLLLKYFAIDFEEVLIKLDLPQTKTEILRYSPSGKVPALLEQDAVIWESMAIMEYLHEKYPDKKMYPSELKKRAIARSLAQEMHGGFGKMRDLMSFHVKRSYTNFDFRDATADIERVKNIWEDCLTQWGGPFLMGDFSIVDAMYAPVVCRFKTYGVATQGKVAQYCQTVLSLPAMQQWYREAEAEDFIAPDHEALP